MHQILFIVDLLLKKYIFYYHNFGNDQNFLLEDEGDVCSEEFPCKE